MKYTMQLIDVNNGNRTAPFVLSREELAAEIVNTYGEKSYDDFYVLVLLESVIGDFSDSVVSISPLMLGGTWVSHYLVKESEHG